jgi:hypothetical protein
MEMGSAAQMSEADSLWQGRSSNGAMSGLERFLVGEATEDDQEVDEDKNDPRSFQAIVFTDSR